MSNKFRIKVEQVVGVDEQRGYEKTECILDVRVEDLSITELVKTIYGIESIQAVTYSGFATPDIQVDFDHSR